MIIFVTSLLFCEIYWRIKSKEKAELIDSDVKISVEEFEERIENGEVLVLMGKKILDVS